MEYDDVEDHYQDDEVAMSMAKNSRDEIIEYNPEELSYEASQSEEDYYPDQSILPPAPHVCHNNHHHDKNGLQVVGKSLPVYNCKHWGKNPYYVVISRSKYMSKPRIPNFDSIDGNYNCLGIDEKEAYKLASGQPLNDNKLNSSMLNSIDDCGHHQSGHKNSSFMDIYSNEPEMAHKPIDALNGHMSQDIIAVNDSDNEMIVPEDMAIHDLPNGHINDSHLDMNRTPMMLPDSIDYMPKNKLSLSKSQLMSSS